MTVQKFQKMIRYLHVMKSVMKNKTTQTNICISSIIIPSHGREFILLPHMTKIKSDHLVRLFKQINIKGSISMAYISIE